MKKFLATTAMILAISGPVAFAQTSTDTSSGRPSTTIPSTTSPTPSADTPSTTTTTTSRSDATTAGDRTVMRPNEIRASKMIGSSVYGPDDKSIGSVSDL